MCYRSIYVRIRGLYLYVVSGTGRRRGGGGGDVGGCCNHVTCNWNTIIPVIRNARIL